MYKEISTDIISKCFEKIAKIEQSKAATYTVRRKMLGENYKGSKRVDFLIKLK